MLSPTQRIVLGQIKDYAKKAKEPIDKKTLKKLLDDTGANLSESSIHTCLQKLKNEGYLRLGLFNKNTYVLLKWE